jgi:hypothetical protein
VDSDVPTILPANHLVFHLGEFALLTGGTAAQNLQFDTVHKERNFQNFSELEIENNRTGLVRWNKMEVVERSAQRFEIKITRCMFHEFAVSVGIPEMTPIVCQIDNAMFNSYLPDEMTFDRGLLGGTDCGWQARMQFCLGIAPAARAGRLRSRVYPR